MTKTKPVGKENGADLLTDGMMCDLLKKSGYLLESRVARTLTRRGYAVDRQVHIAGEDEDTLRELDIRANRRICEGFETLSVTLLIECANNDYPIVAFPEGESPEHGRDLGVKVSGAPAQIGSSYLVDMLLQRVEHHYASGRAAAGLTSFTQQKKDGAWRADYDERYYKAICKLCDAVDYHAEEHEYEWTSRSPGAAGATVELRVIYPIFVLQGSLRECVGDPDNLRLPEVPRTIYRRTNAWRGREYVYSIDLAKEDALDDLLDILDKEVRAMEVNLVARRGVIAQACADLIRERESEEISRQLRGVEASES